MDPALAQLIAVAGPQVVGFLISTIKTIKDESPNSITPEQWAELQSMFSESYDERKARIARTIPG